MFEVTKLNSKAKEGQVSETSQSLFLVLSALSEDSVEAKILADRDRVNEGKERGY